YAESLRLIISGTARIDREGRTLFGDSTERQIEQTLRIVDALLQSRKMGWGDILRSICYFKDLNDQALFERICARTGVPAFPAVAVGADVCRHDLSFEIEVDAVCPVSGRD
ncbi:MAG: Rid family hydrolase, partial [Kiritimatiellia bacterium]|nr:Rid family hydrolase [Kiritimatiellia bacterium]